MIILMWITAFLVIQSSQSYILLTANLDDVQNLMQSVMQSPAVEKVGQYVRRAATLFNQQIKSRDDEKFLKESPIVRQVVNVLRSAYTVIKDQINGLDKDNDEQRVYKKQEVDTVESSVEMDATRRRARHHVHNRHRHSRKHYPVAHRARRSDGSVSETDKANTLVEERADAAAFASEERRDKLKETSEMLALGKNASRYLDTIKEIIQKSTI